MDQLQAEDGEVRAREGDVLEWWRSGAFQKRDEWIPNSMV